MERESTYFGKQEDVMQVAAGGASTALLLTDGRVMTMGQYTVRNLRINMKRNQRVLMSHMLRLSGG